MTEQRFDRLPASEGLFLQVWAETFLAELEEALEGIEDSVADILAVTNRLRRVGSYTSPTNVLEATDAGAGTATITIASHSRIYADATSLAITGGALTGLAYSTEYAVYYTDTTLLVTAPTFVSSTTIATGYVGAAAGRHSLGVITTPAALGAPVVGGGSYAPGSTVGGEIP